MDELLKAFAEVAKSLAGNLKNQIFGFIVLIILIVSTFAVFVTTKSSSLAFALLVVGLLTLLLALLLGQPKARQILTPNHIFVLLLSYVFVVVLLVGFMFYTFDQVYSPAQQADNAWTQSHELDANTLNEGLLAYLRTTGVLNEQGRPTSNTFTGVELAAATNRYALDDETNRIKLYSTVTALEDYQRCHDEGECKDSAIDDRFQMRIREFWSNFKCSIAQLRATGGYDDYLGERIKRRYEQDPERRGSGAIKDSFEMCQRAVLTRADCPPGAPSTVAFLDQLHAARVRSRADETNL